MKIKMEVDFEVPERLRDLESLMEVFPEEDFPVIRRALIGRTILLGGEEFQIRGVEPV